MSKFRIKPVNGGEAETVEADRYEYERETGRHLFFSGTGDTGGDLVANRINVEVTKLPDTTDLS